MTDTLRHKMISTKSLIVVVLLAIYIQNIACKNVDGDVKPANKGLPEKNPSSALRERDLRGLRDVWDQVKSSAISSWNYLKTVAENARERILKLASSARQYAAKLEKSFEEQLQVLQNRLSNIITELLGTNKIVQECLKSEGRNIQDALMEIIKKMSECVSNQIKNLTQIKAKDANMSVNDTQFMTDLDNKMGACDANKADYEECLYVVRELMFDNIKDMDNHIQQTSLESRDLADNIRDTLATCSLQNLADASFYITSEMMRVVKCVMDSRGINASLLE